MADMKKNRFKFRIWSKRENKYLSDEEYNYQFINNDGDLFFFPEEENFCCNFSHGNEVIEQCTGLIDNKGNLIYEGDIVSCCINSNRIGFVEFVRYGYFLNEKGSYSEDLFFSEKSCRVIGNIHQNKELIK